VVCSNANLVDDRLMNAMPYNCLNIFLVIYIVLFVWVESDRFVLWERLNLILLYCVVLLNLVIWTDTNFVWLFLQMPPRRKPNKPCYLLGWHSLHVYILLSSVLTFISPFGSLQSLTIPKSHNSLKIFYTFSISASWSSTWRVNSSFSTTIRVASYLFFLLLNFRPHLFEHFFQSVMTKLFLWHNQLTDNMFINNKALEALYFLKRLELQSLNSTTFS